MLSRFTATSAMSPSSKFEFQVYLAISGEFYYTKCLILRFLYVSVHVFKADKQVNASGNAQAVHILEPFKFKIIRLCYHCEKRVCYLQSCEGCVGTTFFLQFGTKWWHLVLNQTLKLASILHITRKLCITGNYRYVARAQDSVPSRAFEFWSNGLIRSERQVLLWNLPSYKGSHSLKGAIHCQKVNCRSQSRVPLHHGEKKK